MIHGTINQIFLKLDLNGKTVFKKIICPGHFINIIK